MKIVTVLGARPQFIKAAAISRAIRLNNKSSEKKIREVIVHTGQHFDRNMSEVFFTELEISPPNFNLEISGLPHGAMTGRMLESIEVILKDEAPDVVLIYGDTNSTLAAALAASKMRIPVAHVEAGLRSFNMRMPEEINRIVADRLSNDLFCPTEEAVRNLKRENIESGVHLVGDIMYDIMLHFCGMAKEKIPLSKWDLKEREFALCTIHRAENTDDPVRLESIFSALREIARQTTVLLPLHPRTKQNLQALGKNEWLDGLVVVEPLSYLEMTRLEMSAKVVITDSGGIQKEAYFHQVPCVTLRDETEWVETVQLGWNKIVGANTAAILHAFATCKDGVKTNKMPYGDGGAAERVLNIMKKYQ
jgi:UDP-GlcNAc3NAcA epimerase